uniref:Transposase DDE domain-containing protein n=1 Tax=Cereibacter sphaeroides (strain ATCC 17025 / ATH 2.4.3) TaxID=349102 RepID=A4WY64_CERS5
MVRGQWRTRSGGAGRCWSGSTRRWPGSRHAKEDLEGRRCSQRQRSRSACRSRVKGARKMVLWTVFSPERAEPRFRPPLGQTAGMVASLLRLAGLDGLVPDCSTLCRRQESLAVHIPCRRADGPLNLLVDSPGITFLG